MKKFFQAGLLFLVPLICLMVAELLLPATFFTFRTWEGISFATKIPHIAPFYPNSKTFKNATGELCHHTNKAILKPELWITDKLGYRNDDFVEAADVLFIGDSFIAGSGLNQNEIVSNKVKSKLKPGSRVYNMSPGSFTQFDYYLRTGAIKKPKLIIFSTVERVVPDSIRHIKSGGIRSVVYKALEFGRFNMYVDRFFRLASVEWMKARLHNSKGQGIPAKGYPDLFFLEGNSQKHTAEDLNQAVRNIKLYKKYCDSLNIQFVFMPMPDKESVYYEFVPFNKQPDYLFQLDSILKQEGIATINTLKIYNDFRKVNSKLLYHLDDTHWNSTATDLISDEILTQINLNQVSLL